MRDSVPWSISRPARNVRLLLAGFVALAVLLEVMAGTGLAYVAGFHRMRAALAQVDWVWLGVLCGSLGVSCAGYYHAYRAIFAVNDGPPLPRAKLWAVTVAGFSGFLAHGGGKLDQCALEAAGADRAGARVRVTALAGLEQGTLAIGGCAVWAGLAAFGYEMNGAALFVGFATGMVFTRRTGPLAGAGVLTLVLPVTISYCGAPLPIAVGGVFAYRILAFWVPMPVSLAALPALRRLVARRAGVRMRCRTAGSGQ